MFFLLCICPLVNWANFVIHRMYSNWVFRSSRILTWIVIFFGISQKCFMVVPKETKSQSECVDWFRSNQVEIFNKGGIADIGPSFTPLSSSQESSCSIWNPRKVLDVFFYWYRPHIIAVFCFMIILQWPWFDCLANSD